MSGNDARDPETIPASGVNLARARVLHGRGSEILFPDRITAAAWRFRPCRQAVSRKDCTSRRASCPVAANYNRGWRRRQPAPSTPPGETILRTRNLLGHSDVGHQPGDHRRLL